ncbi:MAG: N-formylglutamate amidohydrolase [Phormidesmis sp.]
MPVDLFNILAAQGEPLPVVANLPHSGLELPPNVASQFTDEHLRSLPNSDWHLQPLYSFLPSLGITVMQANYSRYVVDLNRALKPPFFGSFWSAVIPEQTAFKQPVYVQQPSQAEVIARIDKFYTPYHQRLSTLIDEMIAQFGKVVLLDLHSFMGLITDDVCLGNANGKTCAPELIERTAACFVRQGYQVVTNKVFTGGFITRQYGQQPQVEALQIEIRYPLYLPDDQLAIQEIPQWQGPKFDLAQTKLKEVFRQIFTEEVPI